LRMVPQVRILPRGARIRKRRNCWWMRMVRMVAPMSKSPAARIKNVVTLHQGKALRVNGVIKNLIGVCYVRLVHPRVVRRR